MQDEFITKKELLEQYGISYGALYRWKRMGLIQEDWFLKRSAPTGQETVFRRDTVCRRIERILAAKDETSLSALAEELSPKRGEAELVIESAAGRRSYPLRELKAMTYHDGDTTVDLLEVLQKQNILPSGADPCGTEEKE